MPTNLDAHMQTAAVMFAAIESAHTGRRIDVQAFLRDALAGHRE
jgi:hypothetical protein